MVPSVWKREFFRNPLSGEPGGLQGQEEEAGGGVGEELANQGSGLGGGRCRGVGNGGRQEVVEARGEGPG